MRVLLAITDEGFFEDTGYAEAWGRALRERGAAAAGRAGAPPEWALAGPPADRWNLVVAHVLVEEVAAFAPVMKLATVLETAGVPLLNPLHSIVTSSDK